MSRRNKHRLRKQQVRRERLRQARHYRRFGPSPDRAVPADQPCEFLIDRLKSILFAGLQQRGIRDLEEARQFMRISLRRDDLEELIPDWLRQDARWQARELAHEAIHAETEDEAVELAAAALRLDRDCSDAMVAISETLEGDEKIQVLMAAVAAAKNQLDRAKAVDHNREFWLMIGIWPLRRALHWLASELAWQERMEEAIDVLVTAAQLTFEVPESQADGVSLAPDADEQKREDLIPASAVQPGMDMACAEGYLRREAARPRVP